MGKDVIVACDFASAEQTFAFLDKFTGFSLSRHQSLFHLVGSSHQVAKVLEFQLQRQSFQ